MVIMVAASSMHLSVFAASGAINGDFAGEISVPTVGNAYRSGQVQKNIFAGSEAGKPKPWVFADVKLSSERTQNDKLNYSVLALNRAIAYFQDQNKHFNKNDYFIILNNGFIINKDNYNKPVVYDEAKKALLDDEQYQGDTIFTIAFIDGQNKVVRQSMWKLIDMINLAPGSEFTSTTSFNVGVNASEQVTLAETLGLKSVDKIGANLGLNKGGITAGVLAELTTEINETLSRTFNYSNQVSANKNESVSVKHSAKDSGMLILRYQLVDNVNVDLSIFNSITKALNDNMNMGGRTIVKVEPASGLRGIDIPTNIIFDVMVGQ